MTYLHNITDIHRYVTECSNGMQSSQYEPHVIELVAKDLLEIMREKHGFNWGDEMPEISDEEFWALFAPYEIKEDITQNQTFTVNFELHELQAMVHELRNFPEHASVVKKMQQEIIELTEGKGSDE